MTIITTKKMFRNKEVREKEKKERNINKENWYKKGVKKYATKYKIPATKNSKLKKSIEKTLENVPGPNGINMKPVEMPGQTVRLNNMKSDPFPIEKCTIVDCPLKYLENSCKIICYKANVNYAYQ